MLFEPITSAICAQLDELAAPPTYRAFLDAAFSHASQTAADSTPFIPLDLPLAIGEVLGTPLMPRQLVAAACLSVWLGADLFDNVVDDELEPSWDSFGQTRVSLGAVTILTVLPHKLIKRLSRYDVPAATRHALSVALSQSLWQMSVGQFRDLGATNEVRRLSDYETLLAGKSGAEIALFARASALLAERPAKEVEGWHAFGHAIGMSMQLVSDAADIFSDPPGNDLRNGKRTLPIIFALQQLKGHERLSFKADLARAQKNDQNAIRRVRKTMRERGALQYAMLKAEVFRQQALRQLRQLVRCAKARAPLEALSHAISLLGHQD